MNPNSQTNLTIGIVVATVVAAGGTYFAFDYLSRDKTPTAAAAEPAPVAVEPMSPGEAAATAGTPDDPYGAAAADAATRAETGSEASSTDSTEAINAAADAAVAAVGAGTGTGLSAEEARKIGEEVARQVAAQVAQTIVDQQLSAQSTAASGGGLTAEEARRIGEEEGRRVAQEVAEAALAKLPASGGGSAGMTAAEAEQIGLAAGRRAAQQVAADTAREVVRSEFGGKVQSADAPSRSSTGNAKASKPASAVATASTSSRSGSSAKVKTASADALKAWWPGSNGGFGLVYAGQPKGEKAIALLFSSQPNDGALNQSVKVYDANGKLVSGSWESAANPRLAVMRGLKPGRYTVVLESSLADGQGQSLGQSLHGPVYVI